jgi:hypothetical protein
MRLVERVVSARQHSEVPLPEPESEAKPDEQTEVPRALAVEKRRTAWGAREDEDEEEEEEEEEEDESVNDEDDVPVSRRSRLIPKRVGTSWGSLVLMAMAVLSLTFVAWLYVADAPAIEDKDLVFSTPADLVPTITAPGRLEVFLGSLKPVPTPELLAKSPWQWDTASMVSWLVENSQALDNLKDLLEDFDWHGRHASWHFTDLGSHPNWTSAMILKQVEAAYMQRDGKHEAAIAAALDMAELARRLQDIHAWPSFYFKSLETHRRCTDMLAELLQRSAATEEAMASFQQQFEACAPQDEHVRRNVLPGFYLYEKKRLLGAQSGEPLDTMPGGSQRPLPKQLFFKTHETLGLIADTMRHLVRQVGQASASTAMLREIWEGVPGTREVASYQPNGRGAAYARQQLESYLDVPARQQLARTRHLLVLQLFAMRRFVVSERGLPQALDGLRPRYLSELPTDPYSGEPFHYDADNGLLYSVGSDFTAEGGRVELPPLADPREPTVKIGVQKAGVGNR